MAWSWKPWPTLERVPCSNLYIVHASCRSIRETTGQLNAILLLWIKSLPILAYLIRHLRTVTSLFHPPTHLLNKSLAWLFKDTFNTSFHWQMTAPNQIFHLAKVVETQVREILLGDPPHGCDGSIYDVARRKNQTVFLSFMRVSRDTGVAWNLTPPTNI